AFLKDPNFQLSVESESDYFIATHWLTAHYVGLLREAQERACKGSAKSPFVYLIQDFEPAFYAWSSRYLLAAATYGKPSQTIAVFNTALLREYFQMVGYLFPISYVFEPKLNPVLASYKNGLLKHKKRRLILVYGRPGNSRNAFELIVEALRIFAERYKDAG